MGGKPVENRRIGRLAARTTLGAGLCLAGCTSPLAQQDDPYDLRSLVDRAVTEEMAGAAPEGTGRIAEQAPSRVIETLQDRLAELDALGPATGDGSATFGGDVGSDLEGTAQQIVDLGLEQAVHSAVTRNLGVGRAIYERSIAGESIVVAEAAFDFVLFGGASIGVTDQPRPQTTVSNIPIGAAADYREQRRFETGVRKRFLGGGTATVSTNLDWSDDREGTFDRDPDPSYAAGLVLALEQPLLRGFGETVNGAEIRLARNSEASAAQALRGQLEDVAEGTATAYWDLVVAWQELSIREWLVAVGEQVRDVLDRRRDFDAKPAEYADAVARVEERRANVIRARRSLRAASDRLKAFIDDPAMPIGSEVMLRPAETADAPPVEYNLRVMIAEALRNRSEVVQGRLAIADTEIRREVAENALLPQLDLTARLGTNGLDDDFGGAYDDAFGDDFVDWLLGIDFEQAILNRAAESGERIARLRRAQATIALKQTARRVVLEVKDALRDVAANYELVAATRSNRVAQAENLRALLVREETLSGLTPEFLNLKFQRQDSLALARLQEFLALADYRRAIAALDRALGRSLQAHGLDFDEAMERYVGLPPWTELPVGRAR